MDKVKLLTPAKKWYRASDNSINADIAGDLINPEAIKIKKGHVYINVGILLASAISAKETENLAVYRLSYIADGKLLEMDDDDIVLKKICQYYFKQLTCNTAEMLQKNAEWVQFKVDDLFEALSDASSAFEDFNSVLKDAEKAYPELGNCSCDLKIMVDGACAVTNSIQTDFESSTDIDDIADNITSLVDSTLDSSGLIDMDE